MLQAMRLEASITLPFSCHAVGVLRLALWCVLSVCCLDGFRGAPTQQEDGNSCSLAVYPFNR